MSRSEYLRHVLSLYLEAPDTPQRARPSDRAFAEHLYQQKLPLQDLHHAIALVSLKRARRASGLPPLDPIGSLAYFFPVIERIQHQAADPGYALYVQTCYRNLLNQLAKNAEHRQNAAVLGRR